MLHRRLSHFWGFPVHESVFFIHFPVCDHFPVYEQTKDLCLLKTWNTPDLNLKPTLGNESRKPLLGIFGHIWTKSEISDLSHSDFFLFDETLNIFSYRADTSIPTTFVAICVIDSKPVAYLPLLPSVAKQGGVCCEHDPKKNSPAAR